jgi:hypothetical protein
MLPIDANLRDFLVEMDEVVGKRHMHLEVLDGHLVAVDHGDEDPVPVVWDPSLKRYRLAED